MTTMYYVPFCFISDDHAPKYPVAHLHADKHGTNSWHCALTPPRLRPQPLELAPSSPADAAPSSCYSPRHAPNGCPAASGVLHV